MDIISILRGFLGIVALVGITYLFSTNRKAIDWGLVVKGLALQLILAIILINPIDFVVFDSIRWVFQKIVDGFVVMIQSTESAAQFMFGDLAKPGGPYGFAFFVLPTVIFFSALSSLLYYLGILQKVVYGFAWLMKKTMKLSGAESLAAAANVFIGQTEAPLVVKPYLEKMTRSEILCLMTGGMATIAGGVFGAYMGILGGGDEDALAYFGMHLLTASIISAPAAIVAAKILFPETEHDKVNKNLDIPKEEAGSNVLDALSRGTTDGLKLAANVGAMLIAFTAFIYVFNEIFLGIGNINYNYFEWFGEKAMCINSSIVESSGGKYDGFTLQYIFGILFSPIAWLIGVPTEDMVAVGQLLGEKTILNEFFAYVTLGDMKTAGMLGEKSILIATYALCGFANFASIGIQIGGIGAIAPGQRSTLSRFGIQALIGGTIACFLTAAIAGMMA